VKKHVHLSLIFKLERTPKPKDAIFLSYPYLSVLPFFINRPLHHLIEGLVFPYFFFTESCPNGSLNTMAWLGLSPMISGNTHLLSSDAYSCCNSSQLNKIICAVTFFGLNSMIKGKCPSILLEINSSTIKAQRCPEMKIKMNKLNLDECPIS